MNRMVSGMSMDDHALMNLWGRRFLIFDGGFATMLQAMGLTGGEEPETWNLSHPDRVGEVHRQYLAAGCDIVTANTFGATRQHLGDRAEKCLRAGIAVARQAVEEAGHGFVALDMGSLGRLLAPYGDMPFEDAVTQFREAAAQGLSAGADMVLIETMTDLLEVKAAVLGVNEAFAAAGKRIPLFCSLTFDERGRLLTGADIRGTVAMLCGLRVDAIGLNCGNAPKALYENVKELLRWCPAPVFVSPNASLPVVIDGKTTFPTTAGDFGRDMRVMAELGVWGLGGCCGTTPAHIAALAQEIKGMKPLPRSCEPACILSGRSTSVVLGKRPLLIGERLNPTGKPRMKQALKEGDFDFLLREAIAQIEAGADALDVNVGLPEIDEKKILREAVLAIQTVCDLPLQLDTADPAALEAALRVYAGKPLINSVCGKQAVMDAVFPLARQYGGALVALTLDENGIPDTVEGRLVIARRIIAEAEAYGIPKTELLFDALTMTVSTNENAARVTLETVRRLREELGVKTVLGVSNVSFGLPRRPLVTAAFVAMAIGDGLSAAIMNPLDTMVKVLWDAAAAVSGRDEGFSHYLAAYGKEQVGISPVAVSGLQQCAPTAGGPAKEGDTNPPSSPEAAATQAILRGLSADAAAQVAALLSSGMEPTDVIERTIMPALSQVGEKYEQGKLFLPQLLQSAEAAQAAFDEIRRRVPDRGEEGKRVILATVQGDVHDIGKNIVKVLLQNYGFTVTDLGRNVAPEVVVKAARDTGAEVVGLSALMTTTVPAMGETITLLKKELPQVRVMVGGAVLTEEYAATLGADAYGRDAMAAVRLAQKWLKG